MAVPRKPQSEMTDVDPTKNVLDLVEAGSKYHDALLAAATKRRDDLAKAESRRVDEARKAESRRVDDLGRQKRDFDNRMAELRNMQVSDLSKRITDLERTQWVSGGRASVSEPAMADALVRLRGVQVEGGKAEGHDAGQATMRAYLFAGLMAIIAIGAIVVPLIVRQ